eukprot:1174826-Karenia_brevis.AAC.1
MTCGKKSNHIEKEEVGKGHSPLRGEPVRPAVLVSKKKYPNHMPPILCCVSLQGSARSLNPSLRFESQRNPKEEGKRKD